MPIDTVWFGISLHEAQRWAEAGFEPTLIADWLEARIEPGNIQGWADAGFTPEHAHFWELWRFEPQEARQWADAGFYADEARRRSKTC